MATKKGLARRVKIEKNGYSSEAQTVTLELKLYIPVYFLTRCELNLLQIKPFLSQTSMFWTKNVCSERDFPCKIATVSGDF